MKCAGLSVVNNQWMNEHMRLSVQVTMSFLIGLSVLTLSEAMSVKSCSSPLGMESGAILDSQIRASSSFASSVGPVMGRLRSTD